VPANPHLWGDVSGLRRSWATVPGNDRQGALLEIRPDKSVLGGW
jgi:hypothetical protein